MKKILKMKISTHMYVYLTRKTLQGPKPVPKNKIWQF